MTLKMKTKVSFILSSRGLAIDMLITSKYKERSSMLTIFFFSFLSCFAFYLEYAGMNFIYAQFVTVALSSFWRVDTRRGR